MNWKKIADDNGYNSEREMYEAAEKAGVEWQEVASCCDCTPATITLRRKKLGLSASEHGGDRRTKVTRKKYDKVAQENGFRDERHLLETYRWNYSVLVEILGLKRRSIPNRMAVYGLIPCRYSNERQGNLWKSIPSNIKRAQKGEIGGTND
jgi:hypothetical protein